MARIYSLVLYNNDKKADVLITGSQENIDNYILENNIEIPEDFIPIISKRGSYEGELEVQITYEKKITEHGKQIIEKRNKAVLFTPEIEFIKSSKLESWVYFLLDKDEKLKTDFKNTILEKLKNANPKMSNLVNTLEYNFSLFNFHTFYNVYTKSYSNKRLLYSFVKYNGYNFPPASFTIGPEKYHILTQNPTKDDFKNSDGCIVNDKLYLSYNNYINGISENKFEGNSGPKKQLKRF